MLKSLNISLILSINLTSDINLTEVLKKIFNEETEILIKTDVKKVINFKEETCLIKKLT